MGRMKAFKVLECILAHSTLNANSMCAIFFLSFVCVIPQIEWKKKCNHIARMLLLLVLWIVSCVLTQYLSLSLWDGTSTCSSKKTLNTCFPLNGLNSSSLFFRTVSFTIRLRQCHHKHSLVYVIIITSCWDTAKAVAKQFASIIS